MSLYGVPAGFERVDEETLQSWRVGSRLVYALLIDSHYPNDEQGIPVFLDLIENLPSHIQDDESIQIKDTVKMFDVIVKENKPKLLSKILNNAMIPNASHTDNIAKAALKQAIRVGSMDILDFLINANVQIISNAHDGDDNKNKFDDIRSLIFNILQSVRIGYNSNKDNNLIIANKFWMYLSESLYHLYNGKNSDNSDANKTEMKENQNIDGGLLKYTNETSDDQLSVRRYAKFMASHPLIICSVYKCIHSSLSGKRYIQKLKPMLMFMCEHYMTLDDTQNLEDLVRKCESDKLFDCNSLKAFNIKYDHALKQEYGKTKQKRSVKLFWSEYIMIKLINAYFGIEPHKLSTVKRMNQYGSLNIKDIDSDERKDMLYCVKYIVSNGAANHLNDVILPLLQDYKTQFIKTESDNKEMNSLFGAIEYGTNVWTLRQLKDNEIMQLFGNVCNKQIELPLQLIEVIRSFVVL